VGKQSERPAAIPFMPEVLELRGSERVIVIAASEPQSRRPRDWRACRTAVIGIVTKLELNTADIDDYGLNSISFMVNLFPQYSIWLISLHLSCE
jgi:hypothetical protein